MKDTAAPAPPAAAAVPDELEPPPGTGALTDVELDGVLLDGSSIETAAGLRLGESRVAGVDASGAVLTRATLHDVVWAGGSVANARLDDVRIRRSRFEGVRATGANLTRATLDDVVFVDCRLDLALLRAARLSRVRFEDCRLTDADLFEAKLASVVFEDCDLRQVSWADVSATRSELRGCDLAGGSSLERLRGFRMPWSDVLASAGELALAAGIEVIE